MAVYFAPERRDPTAYLKQALLQYAMQYGAEKRAAKRAGKERERVRSFAESIMPPDIPTINDQRLFSPEGQQIAQDAWLGDDPNARAELGTRPGQQTLSTQQIVQRALMANIDHKRAAELAQALGRPVGGGFTLSPGQTRYGPGGQEVARGAPKLTESQQLQAEGYTSEEIRRIRDIKHGIEPRATSRITYDNMTAVEKAKYLATERQKAEGQYFGIEGGNKEPRQPDYLAWVLKEQEKVRQELGGTENVDDKTKSPYPDYPDAFLEDGIWKVKQAGKTYRIEE